MATSSHAATAVLGPDERMFLEQHVDLLRNRLRKPRCNARKVQSGSSMPGLLKKLQNSDEDEFLKIADIFAQRLQDAMASATRPKPGLLAVLSTRDEHSHAPVISI